MEATEEIRRDLSINYSVDFYSGRSGATIARTTSWIIIIIIKRRLISRRNMPGDITRERDDVSICGVRI